VKYCEEKGFDGLVVHGPLLGLFALRTFIDEHIKNETDAKLSYSYQIRNSMTVVRNSTAEMSLSWSDIEDGRATAVGTCNDNVVLTASMRIQ